MSPALIQYRVTGGWKRQSEIEQLGWIMIIIIGLLFRGE